MGNLAECTAEDVFLWSVGEVRWRFAVVAASVVGMSLIGMYAFEQRALIEVLLVSVAAGLLGTWIVLRGLAFYTHAVAAAAFPGLVLAAGLGFAPMAGAMGTGALVAAGVGGLSARRRAHYDVATAL